MAKVYNGTGTRIAKMVGEHAVLDVAAEQVCARARANAAPRMKTGEFSQAFEVRRVKGRRGVTDRAVVNTHPAALAIELGHFGRTADGREGRFVPGQFNLLRAVRGS